MADATCFYCGPTDRELRPYGPGGATICFPCMKASPEREAAAGRVFGALLDANDAISPSGIVAIGESSGPRPFDPRELQPGASTEGSREP